VGTRIGVSGRDSGRLGGIVTSGRDSGGLRGGFGRDSGGLGGGIVDFERVWAAACLLGGGILGSNGCKAFRFALLLALEVRQGAQQANNLPGEPFFAKEESGRFW
jgi:hypothetical protein